jgi:serine/threonine protein kinase
VAPAAWAARRAAAERAAPESMDRARYERLMALFDEACDLSATRQQAFVQKVRAEDADLGEHLDKLLYHDTTGTDLVPQGGGARALVKDLERDTDVDDDAVTEPREPKSEQGGRVGARIGSWLVGERLGAGGIGVVHRATHVESGQVVAIKFLRRGALADPRDVRRFEREFKAVARLDHPGCVKVYEQGRAKIGHYLVLEHVGGGDLRRLTLAPSEAVLPVLAAVADALAYVHAQGIVHRDLKPGNVLLTEEDPPRPKIADFGIARLPDVSAILTGAGQVMGTLDFLSPEQIEGKSGDGRSDVYALGCIAFVLFSGHPPFEGDNFDRLQGRLRREAPPLGGGNAPPALTALCARMLARDPEARPSSAEAAALLQSIRG